MTGVPIAGLTPTDLNEINYHTSLSKHIKTTFSKSMKWFFIDMFVCKKCKKKDRRSKFK